MERSLSALFSVMNSMMLCVLLNILVEQNATIVILMMITYLVLLEVFHQEDLTELCCDLVDICELSLSVQAVH